MYNQQNQIPETLELELTLEELFAMFGHDLLPDSTMDIRDFDVEIKTKEGFRKINALYSTPKYETYQLTAETKTGALKTIECADKHLFQASDQQWVYATNVQQNKTLLIHEDGVVLVKKMELLPDEPEVMKLKMFTVIMLMGFFLTIVTV